ncbi:hypothetical protein [Aquitalea sp. USM4]|uniref:hypothetical protein n=1 Tax=Aquitalea sp. USM4 TaxID=1590041 RepID=UPI00103DE69B|nr:hypothetical protein [Aquitalea sp. USM4]QBJ80523.1 hypothetical protein DKK66_19945 [Aquitalea sp. USM4]
MSIKQLAASIGIIAAYSVLLYVDAEWAAPAALFIALTLVTATILIDMILLFALGNLEIQKMQDFLIEFHLGKPSAFIRLLGQASGVLLVVVLIKHGMPIWAVIYVIAWLISHVVFAVGYDVGEKLASAQ